MASSPTWSTKPGTITSDGFDATPPSVNLKCIVFTACLVSGYWFLPKRNKWVLLFLLYFPYLWMALYDHHYGCTTRRFGPTFLMHFYEWAKPSGSYQLQTYMRWHPRWRRLVAVVDMAVLAGLLAATPWFLAWEPGRASGTSM